MKKPIGKTGTILIIIFTVILAGIAIFTAFRLYQLRQEAVAPNVPSSYPKAESVSTPIACTVLSFTIGSPEPSPTESPIPSGSPTENPTPTQTPVAGEPNSCGGTCGSNSNCASGFFCYDGYCRNPSCPSEADCNCPAGATPTSTPVQESMPQSGTNWPTIVSILLGIITVGTSLILAL